MKVDTHYQAYLSKLICYHQIQSSKAYIPSWAEIKEKTTKDTQFDKLTLALTDLPVYQGSIYDFAYSISMASSWNLDPTLNSQNPISLPHRWVTGYGKSIVWILE